MGQAEFSARGEDDPGPKDHLPTGVYADGGGLPRALRRILKNPDDDLGSVYLTEDDGDDELVIDGRTFV